MLKKIRKRFRRPKVLILRVTPGENIRDAILSSAQKSLEELAYQADNSTNNLNKFAESLGTLVDRGTELGWSFTWETNVSQKKLPTEKKLEAILNDFCDYAQFQLEKGSKNGKMFRANWF